MYEDRFLIETTCLGDDVRSWIDPQKIAPVELVGTVSNIEDLGPVEVVELAQPRVVIVGATASQRASLVNLSPGMIFIDEFADIDVKCLDMIDCQLSGSFIVSDEDQKKLVEMFGNIPAQVVPLELPWAVRKDHRDQPKRGKKGKFKKDWQR